MASGITDGKLNELADAITTDKNLLMFGLRLGFRRSKIDKYISTNRRNESSEGTSTMLFDWKRNTPRAKQIPDLVRALNESDLVEFADVFFPEEGASSVQGKKETASTSASKADSTSSASVDFDDILENIAKELFKKEDIYTLGIALRFGPADIGRYMNANEKQGGTYMGTLAMLRSWRQGQTTKTESTKLKSALLKCGFVKLADDLLGIPQPEIQHTEWYPTDEEESGVHFELITDTPVDLKLRVDEAVISCGIRFSTSGVKLSKAFKVTLDHNAVFTDPQRAEIGFYTRGEGMENFVRIPASTKGYPRCDIRNKDLDLYVDHFSDWWIVARIKQYFIGKRVSCTPYVRQPERPIYSILLCINDDLREVNKKVKEEMAEYTECYPPEPMVVAAGPGSVIIRLLEGRYEPFKEIKEQRKKWNFYRIDRTRVHFLVDAPGAESNNQCLTFLLDQTSSRFASDTDPARITFIQTFDATTPSTYTSAESSQTSGRTPTGEEINDLSVLLPHGKYSKFCCTLGFKYHKHQGVLTRKQNDYPAAYEELLQEWIVGGKTIQDLDAALKEAELGGLITRYKK